MRKELLKSRVSRYIFVGGFAYVTEMAVLFSLKHLLGLSSFKSVAISFWVGFVVAFVLQKLVTFSNYDKRRHMLGKQLVGYSLLVAWNYGFTLVAVKLLESHVSVFVIRSIVILIVTAWNFTVYKQIFKVSEEN